MSGELIGPGKSSDVLTNNSMSGKFGTRGSKLSLKILQ